MYSLRPLLTPYTCRPSLLENSLEIIDPLHVSHGVRRRHSSLDDIDGITEEDELTADDFDSDDGMLDDDGTLNGLY